MSEETIVLKFGGYTDDNTFRLPYKIMKMAGFNHGDEVVYEIDGNKILITPVDKIDAKG